MIACATQVKSIPEDSSGLKAAADKLEMPWLLDDDTITDEEKESLLFAKLLIDWIDLRKGNMHHFLHATRLLDKAIKAMPKPSGEKCEGGKLVLACPSGSSTTAVTRTSQRVAVATPVLMVLPTMQGNPSPVGGFLDKATALLEKSALLDKSLSEDESRALTDSEGKVAKLMRSENWGRLLKFHKTVDATQGRIEMFNVQLYKLVLQAWVRRMRREAVVRMRSEASRFEKSDVSIVAEVKTEMPNLCVRRYKADDKAKARLHPWHMTHSSFSSNSPPRHAQLHPWLAFSRSLLCGVSIRWRFTPSGWTHPISGRC
jgi:hypothetical protein